jgi:hypothetical protein
VPSPPQHHDNDDDGDLTAQVITGIADPEPRVRLNGHAPDGRDNGAPVGVAALHLGGRSGITSGLTHADPPGSAPGRVRSPGGPMARHARATPISPGHSRSDGAGSHPAVVKVRVLGTPAVLDADGGPVRGLRTKSVELLVYLALHRDGAPQADIVAAIWPDVTPERAAQRLSTCLANLRSIIRQVRESSDREPSDADGGDGEIRVEPVVNTGGTYRLDPAIVTVDWWQTVNAYAAAAATAADASDQADRWYELGEALDSLAEDNDYPWIDTGRDRVRQDLARRFGRRPSP